MRNAIRRNAEESAATVPLQMNRSAKQARGDFDEHMGNRGDGSALDKPPCEEGKWQCESDERAGKRRGTFTFKRNAAESQGASRHHDGAATGKLGRSYRCETTKVLSRFSTQNRREQTRQQSSAGTARRRSDRKVGKGISLRDNKGFESLSDSKPLRTSAAAFDSRLCLVV